MRTLLFFLIAFLSDCPLLLADIQQNNEQKTRLKIGAILPLSGSGSYFGEELRAGISMCAEGSSLRIIIEDSQTKPALGVAAFNKLADNDHIDLAIVAFSPISNAIIPVAKKRSIPLILTVVSAARVAQRGGDMVFRYFTSGEQEAPIMARFTAKALSAKKAALLYIEDEYGASYRDAFAAAFSSLGGEIVASEPFFKDSGDFRSQLLKIKAAKPDLLYITGYDTHNINILKQAKQLELDAAIVSGWFMASPEIRSLHGSLLEGVYLTTTEFYHSKEPSVSRFKANFNKKFGRQPSVYAAIACDIVALIAESKASSASELIKELKSIQNYPGLMGRLSVDQDGEITVPLMPARILDGKINRYDQNGSLLSPAERNQDL